MSQARALPNLIVATGHAMLGITLDRHRQLIARFSAASGPESI